MTADHVSSKPPGRFQELPREIRDNIYRHLIPQTAVILRIDSKESIQASDSAKATSTAMKVLQLNQKIRSEALNLMYEESTFIIQVPREQPPVFAIQRAKIPDMFTDSCWIPPTVRQIRHWHINIQWQRNDSSGEQPRNVHGRLWDVVNILAANANTDSVSVKFPCACSFIYGGFLLHLLDRHKMLYIREATGREARDIIKAMLAPLKELRVARR